MVLSSFERAEQILTLENTGQETWPFDTYLMFDGKKNSLKVPEETYVGMLEPGRKTQVRIPIIGPRCMRTRLHQIRYELRYGFKAFTVGPSIEFEIELVRYPVGQNIPS